MLMDLEKEKAEQAKRPVAPAADTDATVHALAVAGLQCHVAPNQEYWGAPLVWGDSHKARSVAECCAACHAHRATAARGGLDKGANSTTCNTWVYCGDKERCGPRFQDCWLKHQEPSALPPADAPRPQGAAMWTSGVVYDDASLVQAYGRYGKLTMHTSVGDLVITLLPELAPSTVAALRRGVQQMEAAGGGCGGCKLYRAEDFGIQGVLLWPGSLHFFINFFDTDWGEAMCWGKVEDLALSRAISKRPIRAKKNPNELSMLSEELFFTMSLSV
ncbi:hypothetical protein GPECTOR_3g84 [Gonium pectorale]|uniref:Apple domain-containing protein n=1 Tax=Gonium pectorale TaxID=33097 RepID=A0A150H080_GONPE|nr:hypothetical protein GPECTOR_3g84 [Gonium pectorale]|eukprot:KXZ55434.1 hypothetical protein GPECTOR_3g84 [Gonium pectorale]